MERNYFLNTYLNDPDYLITLPVPPSVNELYGQRGSQKRFKTQAYKKWIRACDKIKIPEELKLNKVVLQYCYYWKCSARRDTENYVKAVSDYISGQSVKFLKDDNWKIVRDHRITPMGVDIAYPRVEIYVWKLS